MTVTELINNIKPKKDWEVIAKKHAKKHGNTAQYWIDKWNEDRLFNSEVGTLYHTIREEEGEGEVGEVIFGMDCLPIIIKDNTTYRELSVCDGNVYGRIDKIVVKDKKINIIDYKTDESIDTKAFSNEWVKSEKLLPPCNHLDNCNFNEYSLKMSMYMYIVWKQNPKFRIGDIILEHVTLKREGKRPILQDGKPIVLSIKEIKLPYRKEEVKKLL